jgi:tRNA dimethylallyltransferase
MHRNQRQKLVVIVGPTASGKSDLGIFLARKFGGEIISADSRQVYKKMDIGTGKVTKREQKMAKHYLIDIANPQKVFTVSDFKKLGEKLIQEILNKNKIPFIVGGTGFYIDALIKGISLPEIPPDKKLRAELAKQRAEQLFSQLLALDPRRAKTIDPQNKRRLIRALEILKTTGKPIPPLKTSDKYDVLNLGISWPKEILKKRIKLRLNKRLKQGMIKEVKDLLARGVSKKRLHDLGLEYRWVGEYLSGKINYTEMKNDLYKAIVKYSKRQMTWFKRNKEIHWVSPPAGGQKEAEKLIRKFISPL